MTQPQPQLALLPKSPLADDQQTYVRQLVSYTNQRIEALPQFVTFPQISLEGIFAGDGNAVMNYSKELRRAVDGKPCWVVYFKDGDEKQGSVVTFGAKHEFVTTQQELIHFKRMQKANNRVYGENELFKYYSFKLVEAMAKNDNKKWEVPALLAICGIGNTIYMVTKTPDLQKWSSVRDVVGILKGVAKDNVYKRMANHYDSFGKDFTSIGIYCEFQHPYDHLYTDKGINKLMITGFDKMEVSSIAKRFL